MVQETIVLRCDADQLGIDLTSAEYGYEVTDADGVATSDEAVAIDKQGDVHE